KSEKSLVGTDAGRAKPELGVRRVMRRELSGRCDRRVRLRLGELLAQHGLDCFPWKGAKPEQCGRLSRETHDSGFEPKRGWASVEDDGWDVVKLCRDMGCGRRTQPAGASVAVRAEWRLRFSRQVAGNRMRRRPEGDGIKACGHQVCDFTAGALVEYE